MTHINNQVMEFPPEVSLLIKDFAQPCSATLRPNWREGSDTTKALKQCRWWVDYQMDHQMEYTSYTWQRWCYERMIIGPPRYRPYCETKHLEDDDYLTSEEWDMKRCWFNTHPPSDDKRWVKARFKRGVPDWAEEEYLSQNNHNIHGTY